MKGQDYLYRGFSDTDPIFDLEKKETIKVFTADGRREELLATTDTDTNSDNGDNGDNGDTRGTDQNADPYPDFLNTTLAGPRVVEFYAPWCPHCQHFKSTFVKLARDVSSTKVGSDVRFYAISCTAHGPICKDQGVKGYPCIKFFKAGDAVGEKVQARDRLDVDFVLKGLGLVPPDSDDKNGGGGGGDDGDKNVATAAESLAKERRAGGEGDIPPPGIDPKASAKRPRPAKKGEGTSPSRLDPSVVEQRIRILNDPEERRRWRQQQQHNPAAAVKDTTAKSNADPASTSVTYRRSKADVFSDAAASLKFALRHGIYTSNGPLQPERKEALRAWLELLRYALPSTDMERSRSLVRVLTERFDHVVRDEHDFMMMLSGGMVGGDSHGVGNGSGDDNGDWSLSCTRNNPHMGYACGLWDLFHVLTVGVAVTNEQRSLSNKSAEAMPTERAASILKDFVKHFFACDECRTNFVKMYDECIFDRCTRLTMDVSSLSSSSSSSLSSERELALWLWEVHNAVNVRLLHERATREEKPIPTKQNERDAMWPPEKQCPHCWTTDDNDDGVSFDKAEMYMFLKSEYWPSRFEPQRKLRQRVGSAAVAAAASSAALAYRVMTHEGEFIDSSVDMLSHSAVLLLGVLFALGMAWAVLRKQKKDSVGLGKKKEDAFRV